MMTQTIEQTDKEKFEMYDQLDKAVIIGMLIESNKHLTRLSIPKIQTFTCSFYMPGSDTSMKCVNCGKQKFEHN